MDDVSYKFARGSRAVRVTRRRPDTRAPFPTLLAQNAVRIRQDGPRRPQDRLSSWTARRSQARAKVQRPSAVRLATPSTSATSSIVSPTK